MNVTVHITRNDINKSEFLNRNCAESLALKHTLKTLNIHVLDTGVSRNPKNNTMWAEIFYATKHPTIQDAANIHCFKTFLNKKNPKLPKWSATMDSCFNGIWHNGIRIDNITYTHKDKNSIKETSYTITIPQKVINASNDSKWVKENAQTDVLF